MRSALYIAVLALGFGSSIALTAQCTNHTITITSGTFPGEVSWQLVAPGGGVVASGFAPTTVTVCLPVGCYTMYMFDSFGDGWNGATFTVRVQPSNAVVSSGTLGSGSAGQAQVNIGGGCNPPGCVSYNLTITAGTFPGEISWNLVGTTSIITSGFAPMTASVCILPGCYTMQMFDDFGDGWNGATWTLATTGGVTISSGTLGTGTIGSTTFAVGVPPANCASTVVTASDCAQAVNVCTNIAFQIDPNGAGSLNEIPPLGSLGNPNLIPDFINSAWGTDNWGCLRNNELNSTWMVVNIQTGGSLEFIFGGLGTQAGFYDWIMYPYSASACSQVIGNTLAPVRCNWNGVSYGGTGLVSSIPPGGDVTNYEPPLNVLTGQRYLICFSNWSSVTTSVPLVFGGTAVVSCTPLPVELIAFDATVGGARVSLEWTTASELNSLHFEVERSADMVAWEKIDHVQAMGNAHAQTGYASTDHAPLPGMSYYRLRMVDLDGSFTLSPVRSVRMTEDKLVCHPNPTCGSFTVLDVPEGATIEVLDMLGRSIAVEVRMDPLRKASVDLRSPAPGLYTVRMGQGADVAMTKVLIAEQ